MDVLALWSLASTLRVEREAKSRTEIEGTALIAAPALVATARLLRGWRWRKLRASLRERFTPIIST
jgi:hypothetical protein